MSSCASEASHRMNTTIACPRCGQWLAVDLSRAITVTCPNCLGDVMVREAPRVHRSAPTVLTPRGQETESNVPAPRSDDLPVDETIVLIDVTAELRRDLVTALAGIAAFAVCALMILVSLQRRFEIPDRDRLILGWVTF